MYMYSKNIESVVGEKTRETRKPIRSSLVKHETHDLCGVCQDKGLRPFVMRELLCHDAGRVVCEPSS